MTWAARATGSIDRLAGHFGGGDTVTLRRHNTLKNRTTGALYTALAVDGTTAAGLGTIDLDAVNLTGNIVTGITFTVAGDATVYTVAAAVTAASGTLTGVTFTPVLAAEAADDAVVTLATQSMDYTFTKSRRGFMDRELSEQILSTDAKIVLSALGQTIEPNKDDQILEDGEPLNIKEVRRVKPGDTAAGWVVVVRA